MVMIIQRISYPKEVNWDRHTATLRTTRKEHLCAVCKQPIPFGEKAYEIVLWGAGLAGKKFPDYAHPDHLKEYVEACT